MMNPQAMSMVGNQALAYGQSIVERQGWFSWHSWKPLWNVDHGYVLRKCLLLVFPFRHKQWSRQVARSEMSGQYEGFKVPRQDVNAPDLYIPIMAFVTYILVIATVLGTRNQFKPEVLTMIASSAMACTLVEVLFLRLGIYLLNVKMSD